MIDIDQIIKDVKSLKIIGKPLTTPDELFNTELVKSVVVELLEKYKALDKQATL